MLVHIIGYRDDGDLERYKKDKCITVTAAQALLDRGPSKVRVKMEGPWHSYLDTSRAINESMLATHNEK